MLKSLCLPLRGWLEGILRERLSRLHVSSKSLAKHADRTEFHCSGKLVPAARADASLLHFHGLSRPSEATRTSQRVGKTRLSELCPLRLILRRPRDDRPARGLMLAAPFAGGTKWSRSTKNAVFHQE